MAIEESKRETGGKEEVSACVLSSGPQLLPGGWTWALHMLGKHSVGPVPAPALL